jgi:hypothetical protein
MKSSIPSRVEIQGLLSDLNLVKKFSSDVRKFSHHREGSIFFEEYNVGANYDGNVIFSPSSYVPKTAMLNLTVDVFGQSINLMEVCAIIGVDPGDFSICSRCTDDLRDSSIIWSQCLDLKGH